MIIKQCQYLTGPKGKPDKSPALLSVSQVKKLLNYLIDKSHRNHRSVDIGEVHAQHCDYDKLHLLVGAQAKLYLGIKLPGNRPGAWGGDVAEHLVICPYPGVRLDEAERGKVVSEAFQKLADGVAAVAVWHLGKGTNVRDELHIVVSSFRPVVYELPVSKSECDKLLGRSAAKTSEGVKFPVSLRTKYVRKNVHKNYRTALLNLSEKLISEINYSRIKKGVCRLLPTIHEVREKAKKLRSDLVRRIFREFGEMKGCLDPVEFESRLKKKEWFANLHGKPKPLEVTSRQDGMELSSDQRNDLEKSPPKLEGPTGLWLEIAPPRPRKKEKEKEKTFSFRFEHLLMALWHERESQEEKYSKIRRRLEQERLADLKKRTNDAERDNSSNDHGLGDF